MRFSLQGIVRRTLLTFMCVALACNLMIPVGYMPAEMGSGSPVMLCRSVLPIGVLHDHGAHDSRHDDADESRVVFCPLGTLAGTLVLPGTTTFNAPLRLTVQSSVPEIRSAIRTASVPFNSRAPPSDLT